MKTAHALVVGDGGSTTEFACACGMRGTYEDVLRHVTASTAADLSPSLRSQGFPQRIVGEVTQRVSNDDDTSVPADSDDFGGGSTKAHYLPNEPKRPALPAPLEVAEGATPSYIEPEQTSTPVRSRSNTSEPLRSIAEAFQDMLRVAYQAGAASAATGESFETWYQREVLR
jgi:hypothetical protein